MRAENQDAFKLNEVELAVKGLLDEMGALGYETRYARCPGRPGFAFPESKLAIYVYGCFWHGCPECDSPMPKNGIGYWEGKIASNSELDAKDMRDARAAGWCTMVIWQHDLAEERVAATERRLRDELGLRGLVRERVRDI